MFRREWTDPDHDKVPFGPYATVRIAEGPGLRPRTVYLYQWTLAKHLGRPDSYVWQYFSCVERVTGIEPALSAWEW